MTNGDDRPTAGESGFTILEVVIASAILLLALLLANQLLVESQRRVAVAVRAMLEPEDRLALRQLRNDLQAAVDVRGWPSGELDCRRLEMTARWELDGETLSRRSFDALGYDRGARRMLDGIVSLRWRPLSPRTFEIEIVRKRARIGAQLRASSPLWHLAGDEHETARIVATSRSGS